MPESKSFIFPSKHLISGKMIEDFNDHFKQDETKKEFMFALSEFKRLEKDKDMASYTYTGLNDSFEYLKENLSSNFKEKDHYSGEFFPLFLFDPVFHKACRVTSSYEPVRDTLNTYRKYHDIQRNIEKIKEKIPEMSNVCDQISDLSQDLFTHGLKIANSGRVNPLEGKRFSQHMNHLVTLTSNLVNDMPPANAFKAYKKNVTKTPWLKFKLGVKKIYHAFENFLSMSPVDTKHKAMELGLSQRHEDKAKSITDATALPFFNQALQNKSSHRKHELELATMP